MANVILNIRVTDAETDEPIDLLDDGSRPSVLILPVSAPVPALSFVQDAVEALLAIPANGPIPPEAPLDKSVTGSPEFAAFDLQIPVEPRIYRVDPVGLSIDLGLLAGEIAGWYIATIPPSDGTWEFEPTLVFVTKSQDLTITGYKNDLTPLAREVLRLRVLWKPQHDLMVAQWGGQESTAVWDMTYNYVYNTLGPPPEGDPLQPYWGDYVWMILDLGVPAREFDLLVERYTRVQTILANVAWPIDLPYFRRCAQGMPITLGKDGQPLTIANWRLCSPTFSDYFPRDDKQIMQDLGLLWLANLGPIFQCVVKKVIAAQKEAKETAKTWKFVSAIIPILILPSPALIVTTVTDLVAYTFFENIDPKLLQAILLAEGIVIGMLGGGVTIPATDLSTKAFDAILKLTQQMIESEGLQAVVEAAKDAEKLQIMVNSVTGLDQIPPILIPFVTWCLRVGVLDVLMAQLLSALSGQEVNPQTMITYPLIETAQAAGIPIPASLLDMVEGKNPDFPAQAPSGPSAVTVAAVGGGIVVTVLGVLALTKVI
jgi:hypothetical protein